MDFLVPKHRRDPNEKIEAIYSGVTRGNRTVTTVVRPSEDRTHMVAEREYGPVMERGAGGRVAILVLGGMETTLDEMRDILEMKRQKPFVPRRSPGEIAEMCRLVAEKRNEQIMEHRRRPSGLPKKSVKLHLPVGARLVDTNVKGLKILAGV